MNVRPASAEVLRRASDFDAAGGRCRHSDVETTLVELQAEEVANNTSTSFKDPAQHPEVHGLPGRPQRGN